MTHSIPSNLSICSGAELLLLNVMGTHDAGLAIEQELDRRSTLGLDQDDYNELVKAVNQYEEEFLMVS